jgi:hypothetical protein
MIIGRLPLLGLFFLYIRSLLTLDPGKDRGWLWP